MIDFDDTNAVKRDEGFVALLVGVRLMEDITRSMEELEALVAAAGGMVAGVVVQQLERRHPATCIGQGKLGEVATLCAEGVADTVVFNEELSGAQIRNLEEACGVRVIDRTILILDIFARRAKSREGKLQVELAQLSYRLPRLTGFGRSLSRLGGGVGTRGPGEKKLESDRRHIAARIDDIKAELARVERTGETKSKRRRTSGIPVIALVGYTNAGKSAMMNRLLAMEGREEKDVYSEDMLFATLDAEQRRFTLPNGRPCILSDTVGFVSKLPHALIKAFSATLKEAVQADLLLHVVDATFPEREFHIDVTERVLREIGAGERPTLLLYNKADLLPERENFLPTRPGILTSAKTGEGMEEMLLAVQRELYDHLLTVALLIPYDKGEALSYVCDQGTVHTLEHRADGTLVRVTLTPEEFGKVRAYATV